MVNDEQELLERFKDLSVRQWSSSDWMSLDKILSPSEQDFNDRFLRARGSIGSEGEVVRRVRLEEREDWEEVMEKSDDERRDD
jgi:hypothetical protein